MRDRSPLPIDDAGNGERVRTLAFDAADAPMLMRAMSLAAATAMMRGGDESVRRLRHYQAQFAALAPKAAELLDHETDLCEIGIAAATATSWTIHRVREHQWSKTSRTIVEIGGRRFRSQGLVADDALDAIAAMVEDVAPTTCERVARDDEIGSPWFA